MEKLSIPAFSFATKSYCLLTKPGILFGNAITTVGGFMLASKGLFDFWLFFGVLIGLSLIIASACVFNNYIDRIADAKMSRTKNRALAKQLITPRDAILFALLLGLLGISIMLLSTNLLALFVALFGFFVYVILYSFSKYHSIHGTLIGSIAGSVPPVVGYCAACGRIDVGAFILFFMIAMWQMPHFFAIAIYRLEEYVAASIPVLPVKKGIHATKIQMLLYIAAFIVISSLLFFFHYVSFLYLILTLVLGLTWAFLCACGFKSKNDRLWSRKMFFFSLIVIMGLSIAIPFCVLP